MINDALLRFAIACDRSSTVGRLFSLPKWYEYLDCTKDDNGNILPRIVGINNIWLIVAAVIDILLRIAALVAIGFVIYGGVEYITSQGDPNKTAQARGTIISAIVGLVLAVAATALITFVAHALS